MQITEFVVQGLGQAQQPVRISCSPGHNTIVCTSAEIATKLQAALAYLLFPMGGMRSGDLRPPASGRFGLILQKGDKKWRLMRDFMSHKMSLAQFRKDTGNFDEIASQPDAIAEQLNQLFGLPQRESYLRLFTLHHFRSTLTRAVVTATSDETSAEDQVRIEELRTKLSYGDEIRDLEYEIDELDRKNFELEAQWKEIQALEAELNESQQSQKKHAAESADQRAALPADIEERVAAFLELGQRKQAELEKLKRQHDKASRALNSINSSELYKNHYVTGGAAAALLMLILAFALPAMKIVGVVGTIAGLGCSVFGFFQWSSSNQEQGELTKKSGQLDHDLKSVEKRYDIEMSSMRHLMRRLNVAEPRELLKLARSHVESQTNVSGLEQRLAQAKKECDYDTLNKTMTESQLRREKLQSRLATLGEEIGDPTTLRMELEQLEGGSAELGFGEVALPGFDEPETVSQVGSSLRPYIETAANLLSQMPESLTATLSEGYQANLSALSGQQLECVSLEGDQPQIKRQGGIVQFDALNNDEQEIALFALQFTLLQLLAKNDQKWTLCINCFLLPSFSRSSLFHKALGHLEKYFQALLFIAEETNSDSAIATI